jgi:hypothetical protein
VDVPTECINKKAYMCAPGKTVMVSGDGDHWHEEGCGSGNF